MKSFSILCAALFSLNAIADDYTTILQNLYNSATAPAVVTDFNSVIEGSDVDSNPNQLICAYATSPTSMAKISITNVVRAYPSAGPLIPIRTEARLCFDSSGNIPTSFDNVTSSTSNSDLILTQTARNFTDPNTGATTPISVTLSLRESSPYIVFALNTPTSSDNSTPSTVNYGYCYRPNNSR